MENLLKKINELWEKAKETWRLLDMDGKKSKVKSLKLKMNKSDFWKNQERAVEISKEAEELDSEIREWEELIKEITELEELVAVGNKETQSLSSDGSGDEALFSEELEKTYKELLDLFAKQEFAVLFDGKHDSKNAIIAIHAGTGGVDAQDWALILERMYLRFAEKQGWKAEILDRTMGNEAGIKSNMIRVSGRWAYGYLKSEAGVHRLVRISPFDAESMRHTSFTLVEVIPELPEAEDVELRDEDLKIDVFKSSGPGGQGVNTTDSAVRITHLPSKLTVSCQSERSQHQNKETALKILKSKLYKQQEETREKEEKKLRGETQQAAWGKQIRSYVMQPYKLVKDHRTNYETADIDKVLDGELAEFMQEYLRQATEST